MSSWMWMVKSDSDTGNRSFHPAASCALCRRLTGADRDPVGYAQD